MREGAKPFESLVPLPEVLAASTGYSSASRKVQGMAATMEMPEKQEPTVMIWMGMAVAAAR